MNAHAPRIVLLIALTLGALAVCFYAWQQKESLEGFDDGEVPDGTVDPTYYSPAAYDNRLYIMKLIDMLKKRKATKEEIGRYSRLQSQAEIMKAIMADESRDDEEYVAAAAASAASAAAASATAPATAAAAIDPTTAAQIKAANDAATVAATAASNVATVAAAAAAAASNPTPAPAPLPQSTVVGITFAELAARVDDILDLTQKLNSRILAAKAAQAAYTRPQ